MTSKTNSDSAKLQVSYNHIHNYSIQSNYYLSTVNNQKIKFGFQLSQQYLTPNIYDFLTPDSKVLEDSVRMISNENAIFVEDEMILSHKIKLNIGTRFSQYHVGKKNYWGVEPRLAGSFHIFKKATFKISYSRMKQFVHVIPGTGNGFPVDLWITSTEKIEPGISDLFSIGVFCQPSENINISVEGYYSAMANVVRYFETDYVYQSSGSWEDKILKGQGQSYGIELFADKSKGRFTGWASYTLSWSNRVFSQINYGEKFPYAYDRRHQVKLALSYDLFEKQKSDKKIAHSVSSSFVFLSGNYVTFPTLEYHAQALPYQDNVDNIWNLSGRYIDGVNNFQMPNYQRLDLSYKIIIDKKNKRSIWDFGIYNVYNHMNVFYIYKSEDQIKQITFFPIIPSITFTHRF
jgi:outer membrane receptor for ferrienterochelin and colicin